MKTISIRLDDSTYEELGAMLEAMGQTKQTFLKLTQELLCAKEAFPLLLKLQLQQIIQSKIIR